MIKDWLRQENITEFDHLHRLALSNLYLRESRHYFGVTKLVFIFKAWIQAPKNGEVYKQIKLFWQDGKLLLKTGKKNSKKLK